MVFTVLTTLTAITMLLYQTYAEYEQSHVNGQHEAERLAHVLSTQLEHKLDTVDLLLQQADERYHLNQLFGKKLPKDVAHNFKRWVDSSPYLVSMVLINEKGQVEIGVNHTNYSNWLNYNQSFAKFASFTALRNDDSDPYIVSPYVSDKEGVPPVLIVARRVSLLSGKFGGIVIAAIDPAMFLEFFTSIDTGQKRYADIVLSNGESLFSSIDHTRRFDMTQPVWQQIKQQQRGSGTTHSMLYDDHGHTLALAYHRAQAIPITTVVAIDEEEFLYDFWQERLKDISFLVLFIVFGSIGSFFMIVMVKQVRRVEQSESAAILASQAKSEFLANMSHELRTPLNAIIGFSEMMNAGYFGPMNSKQKERMSDITLCGNHLLHLINDILEFSKGEAGRLELIEEKVSVRSITEETLRIMQEKIKSKHIIAKVEMADDMPLLFADKRKLKQVLINLISNAIKFTPPRGTITVSADCTEERAMKIQIIDTGIGIAEDDISTALAVFGQVHRSQSHEGTGLGLPLCRMFTELHSGKLSLSSILGEGTTVELYFPPERVIIPDAYAA